MGLVTVGDNFCRRLTPYLYVDATHDDGHREDLSDPSVLPLFQVVGTNGLFSWVEVQERGARSVNMGSVGS